jgi:nitroreductase
MDVFEAIHTRRSVRAYRKDPIPEGVLGKVLDAARLAPSAGNRQPWLFIVVRSPEVKEKLRAAYGAEWMYDAPVVVCACGVPGKAWVRSDGRSYMDVDVTIAMEHLILEAWEQGLGTCWIGAFDAAKLREALELPADLEPIAMTPLGYPAEEPCARPRKPMEEFARFV